MEKDYVVCIICFLFWLFYIITKRPQVTVKQCVNVKIGQISK